MQYEILDDEGNVINVIVATEEFVQTVHPARYRLVELEELQPPPVVKTQLSRLGFLNRFTDAEAINIDLLSIGATVPAATLRRFMQKVYNATYIDVGLQETIAGVTALETMGIIAVGRAAQILSTTITEGERYRGTDEP